MRQSSAGGIIASLFLSMLVDNAMPNQNDNVVLTVGIAQLTGPFTDTVTITLTLPAGMVYVSNSPETGSYNSGTGVWTLTFGSGTKHLQVTAQVTSAIAVAPSAMITTSSLPYISTGSPATVTITPVVIIPGSVTISSADGLIQTLDLKSLMDAAHATTYDAIMIGMTDGGGTAIAPSAGFGGAGLATVLARTVISGSYSIGFSSNPAYVYAPDATQLLQVFPSSGFTPGYGQIGDIVHIGGVGGGAGTSSGGGGGSSATRTSDGIAGMDGKNVTGGTGGGTGAGSGGAGGDTGEKGQVGTDFGGGPGGAGAVGKTNGAASNACVTFSWPPT